MGREGSGYDQINCMRLSNNKASILGKRSTIKQCPAPAGSFKSTIWTNLKKKFSLSLNPQELEQYNGKQSLEVKLHYAML